MRRITILGSNGYIGQHIAQKLFDFGYTNLNLFDIQEKSLFDKGTYQQFNILNPLNSSVEDILSQSDYIFLFVGLTGTLASITNYQNYLDINESGLLKILNLFTKSDHKPKIIFPSTRLVYKGVANKLLKEDDEKEFKTIYATTKYSCEQYLKIFSDLYGINYTIFRICVPYGSMLGNQQSYGTLSHFINKAAAGQNITLYGNGQLKRTFTHISDLTEIIVNGGLSDVTNNQVFNIGSNDHLSLYNVASSIAAYYNVKVEFTDFPKNDLIIESGDTIFDSEAIKFALNYEYQHIFENWITTLAK